MQNTIICIKEMRFSHLDLPFLFDIHQNKANKANTKAAKLATNVFAPVKYS